MHTDLLEDVILAVIVASTTVATLYFGWKAGRRAIGTPGADNDRGREPSVIPLEDEGRTRTGMIGDWQRRISAEQARHVRRGAPATVVAMRLGPSRGPLARRSGPEVSRTAAAAERVANTSRASDVVCVTDGGTIRILLVDTIEDGARPYVDRMSRNLRDERDDQSSSVLAGWASIASSRDLAAADRLAVARLRGAAAGRLRSLAIHRTTDSGDAALVIDDEQPAPATPG